jgi:histidyl-tRNA synthetase
VKRKGDSEISKISVAYPKLEDAESIKSIQDSWLGARIGSEGFLLSPESLERLRAIIESRNILVARQADEIVSYITFYRRQEWEVHHSGYTANLDYKTKGLRKAYENADYVLIDHIARSRSYTGDAAVRLVVHLTRMLQEWGVGLFLGEISPENQRSTAFFTKTMRATHVASTVRNNDPWDIYAAPV